VLKSKSGAGAVRSEDAVARCIVVNHDGCQFEIGSVDNPCCPLHLVGAVGPLKGPLRIRLGACVLSGGCGRFGKSIPRRTALIHVFWLDLGLNVLAFGDVPRSEWVAENGLAFAIRDRFPVSPGHSLVITRRVGRRRQHGINCVAYITWNVVFAKSKLFGC